MKQISVPAVLALQRIGAADGWARTGLAAGAGALAGLAMAPLYALPLMAAAYSILVVQLDSAAAGPKPLRTAALTGWLFGFGYFLVGVYWMAFAFLVQAEEFAWMAPFAVLGMAGFLALFPAVACLVATLFQRPGWRRILILAACLATADYLRGHILTGLPWNLPGQALAGLAMTAQSAAWLGAYGLSLVALIGACLPVAFVGTPFGEDGPPHTTARALAVGAAASLAVYTALAGVGAVRLALNPAEDRNDAFVRIVQPNIPQREKIDPALWGRNVKRTLDLSAGPGPAAEGRAARGTLYIVWPENAAALIGETPSALEAAARTLPRGSVLLAGAVRREAAPGGSGNVFYNSLAIIPDLGGPDLDPDLDRSRAAIDYYDKHHLVPFGEYLPMRGLLTTLGLAQLAPYESGFAKGEGPRTIAAGPAPFAPLICYEAIFPGALHPRDERPDWLVAVTNDAWFGDASGPLQHLDQARLRAIESGLPMARSANTGASALIDGMGRYRNRIGLYETGVIDAPLPIARAPTLYGRIGDLVFMAGVILCLVSGLWPRGLWQKGLGGRAPHSPDGAP